jgi:hypothetical protein
MHAAQSACMTLVHACGYRAPTTPPQWTRSALQRMHIVIAAAYKWHWECRRKLKQQSTPTVRRFYKNTMMA